MTGGTPKLTPAEFARLENHYTGNCFSCERCSFYEPIRDGVPGAVEAYVRYMREAHGTKVKTTSG